MTPPAVSAPPQPAAPRASAPAPAKAGPPRAPFSRPRPGASPLFTGRTLLLSLGLHGLVAIGLLLLPARQDREPAFTEARAGEPRESVQYMDIGEWGGVAAGGDAQVPQGIPAPEVSAATVDSILAGLREPVAFPRATPSGIPAAPRGGAGVPGGAAPGAGAPGAGQGGQAGQGTGAGQGRTGVGRLGGPEYGDERLVVQPQAIPERVISREERYQRHFEARINAMNDSIAGEAERRRRANDWTIKGPDGRRYGIDGNGPVVAGRNVPIPVPLPGPRSARDREDEARRERDQRRDIDRQAEQIERERHLRERGRATRERENARRREQGEGQTPPQQPNP